MLDESFGLFMSRCEKSPSTKALSFLDELAVACCEWYSSEAKRRAAVQQIINKHTSLEFSPQVVHVDGSDCTSDGNLTVEVMPASIRECKDSHGSAVNQAILYYARYLYNAIKDPDGYCNYNTHFPCIILVDIGAVANLNFSFNH